jgi:hypothetical protein
MDRVERSAGWARGIRMALFYMVRIVEAVLDGDVGFVAGPREIVKNIYYIDNIALAAQDAWQVFPSRFTQ